MRMRARALLASAALAATCGATLSTTGAATSAPSNDRGGYSFAVIGDVPYGAAQIAAFPSWIQQINAANPAMTVHVGDIKNGSSRCDDPYYRMIRTDFDMFTNPLVYTPGDNEWTDCHRTNNGAYNPLERLAFDRSVFFNKPGTTMGQNPTTVQSQNAAGFPENVNWSRARVQFAAIHVVGSNNDRQPWTGLGYTEPTPQQLAEERARMDNSIKVVREAFAKARKNHSRAVAIFQQADMFDPSYTPNFDTDISAFKPLVQALVEESQKFDGDVYLFNGDSHKYNTDRPLASGSPWLATYGVQGSANNLQRVTVDGSDNNRDWLRVSVNRPSAPTTLRWVQVPYLP